MNSKKKMIGSIIAVLCICVMAVFVFPSPNAYLLKVDVSGEKKTGYSLYKSTSISSKMKRLEFSTQLPEGVTKYDESKARYGSPSYNLVLNGTTYRFYRLARDTDVLVTKTGISLGNMHVWIERHIRRLHLPVVMLNMII